MSGHGMVRQKFFITKSGKVQRKILSQTTTTETKQQKTERQLRTHHALPQVDPNFIPNKTVYKYLNPMSSNFTGTFHMHSTQKHIHSHRNTYTNNFQS